jgi:copper chaperone NosL
MKMLLAGFALLLLTACAAQETGPQPPNIVFGQDICDECAMLISDGRFAAATLDLKGDAHKFDDIGGMLMYHMDHPESQVKAYFVHDYYTQTWLRGETAFYVRSEEVNTPMHDGIAAFANRATAQEFATKVKGTVYELDELRVNVHLTLHSAH